MTRVHIPIHRRWGDLDALGHVNNTSMLKLLEEARLRAFWRSADPQDQAPTAVFDASVLEGGGAVATLIARQEIEYLAPVPYEHKPLDVQIWLGRIGGASAEVCYEVYSPFGSDPQVCYARASAVVVLVDTATGRPTRLSDEVRETWAPYVEEPISFARR
ncbi:acyl-CoA thioesterase [Microbacterium paludicola]|uniref:Acyl-CoA thioesterase n=1 Tax=Microbacterium paludicola TaxID=300019 RepID=A0A4Y9FYR3_9MICO|nr:thioesterase family protein [Microbacterium paludicola]MBF0814929.1 acyl-CoA thioesterase [Microbacterium paludicola]TFU34657.1 acyl-CoA thioesterase [Microbacterium paludicola]